MKPFRQIERIGQQRAGEAEAATAKMLAARARQRLGLEARVSGAAVIFPRIGRRRRQMDGRVRWLANFLKESRG